MGGEGQVSALREHDRLITANAKRALTPLGFKQKGRSRVWWADRGFWLNVVEFQPSGLATGSYLNVTPHWLWGLTDSLSFDRPVDHVRTFIEFEDAQAFNELAWDQAQTAALTSAELDTAFEDIQATAKVLIADQREGRRGGWRGFHAAMAAGLSGDCSTAQRLLQETIDSFSDWRSDFNAPLGLLLKATTAPEEFRALVEGRISDRRAQLGLKPWR